MGGISIIVHGNTTCLDVIPLPIPSAQINTDFFSFQGTFFTAPLTYEMCFISIQKRSRRPLHHSHLLLRQSIQPIHQTIYLLLLRRRVRLRIRTLERKYAGDEGLYLRFL